MADGGFPLIGIDPASPLAETLREISFAQDIGGTGVGERTMVIVANATSDGSQYPSPGASSVTISDIIVDAADVEAKYGKRSEIRWAHWAIRAVNQNIPIRVVPSVEGSGATAAAKDFVFATTSTGVTTCVVEWGGESVEVSVATGDLPATIASAVSARINQQVYWPFTAGVSTATVTCTAANLGPRGDLVIERVRMFFRHSIATTVTPGSLTPGATADDVTPALTALAAENIYYHVCASHVVTGPTATDNGMGEYATFIKTQALPANGKEQIVGFGFVGTQAQATTVATDSDMNTARAVIFRAEDNDWTPIMIAAHCMAAKALLESQHPGANLSGYTNTDATPFLIPDPYDKTDRPTRAELTADLNNGVTPIEFDSSGRAKIHRQITTYSVGAAANTKDYRAREGHIPSVADYFWAQLKSRYAAQKAKLPFVADDPPQGAKPIALTATPSMVRAIIAKLITDMCGPFIQNSPVLNPGRLNEMINAVQVVRLNDGFSVQLAVAAVLHNNKALFKINEISPAV